MKYLDQKSDKNRLGCTFKSNVNCISKILKEFQTIIIFSLKDEQSLKFSVLL